MLISLCYTNVNAQPPTGPGGGSPFPDPGCDIDSTCPVDAWVFIIAMVALIFAAMQIHKKQKALLN